MWDVAMTGYGVTTITIGVCVFGLIVLMAWD